MEENIKVAAAFFGISAGYLFGGWDVFLKLLLILVIADWVTGWVAAAMRGELRSRVAFFGSLRKVVVFGVVYIAHVIDIALNLTIFQDAVVFFYIANELLSVTENLGKMGVPIPDILKNAVHIFQSKNKAVENPQLIDEAQPVSVIEEKQEEEANDVHNETVR